MRRWLWPPLATAVTVLFVVAQVAIVFGFALSYIDRGKRIADLEAALCEERVARLSRLAMPQTSCPDADKILARVLPQRWTPIAPAPAARVAARVMDSRPRQEFPEARGR
jgi:hypothetical protein